MSERGRHDRIEVVSIDDGEPLLYWDLPARDAAKLVRQLREDLVAMSAPEFLALWEGADGLSAVRAGGGRTGAELPSRAR